MADIVLPDLDKAERYYEKGLDPANKAIYKFLRDHDKAISHGGHAINAQLPTFLEKATEDWDIFSPDPEVAAKRLANILNKEYGGKDYFAIFPAEHPGTFRIKSTITKRSIADITAMPDGKIDVKKIKGINYASLPYFKSHIKETLKDPNAKFRWDKDKEVLTRIAVAEKIGFKPKSCVTKVSGSSISSWQKQVLKALKAETSFTGKAEKNYVYIDNAYGGLNYEIAQVDDALYSYGLKNYKVVPGDKIKIVYTGGD